MQIYQKLINCKIEMFLFWFSNVSSEMMWEAGLEKNLTRSASVEHSNSLFEALASLINWKKIWIIFLETKMSQFFIHIFKIFVFNWGDGPELGSLILIPFHKGNRTHVPKNWPLESIETKNWKRLEKWWHLHSRKVFLFFLSIHANGRGLEA